MYNKEKLQNLFITILHEDWKTSYQETEHKIDLNLQGITYTEKAAYFIGCFIDQLRYAVYLAVDVIDQSELSAAAKDLAFGAVTAVGGKFLLGDTKAGVLFQGINTALTIGISKKHCRDIAKAKAEARKIISFLAEENHDNNVKAKYVPGKQINRLAIRFWREFRLHIELLIKGEDGSKILIDYLAEQIINTLLDAPETMVTNSFEDTLKNIRRKIYAGEPTLLNFLTSKFEIPDTKLVTENVKNVELDWNLREMLLHSPRIICNALTQPNSSEPMLEFQTYVCTATKKRHLKMVDADDSHKYPSVFLMNPQEINQLPNFKQTGEKLVLKLPQESTRTVTDCEINQELYLQLYFYARKVKRSADDSNPCFDFIYLMTYCKKTIKNILTRCENLSKFSWLLTSVEIINLINIFDKYIINIVEKNNNYLKKEDPRYQDLYDSCCNAAKKLGAYFHVSQEVSQSIAKITADNILFFQAVAKLPTVNFSEFRKTEEAKPYLKAPQIPPTLPIYVSRQDKDGDKRHDRCRIGFNECDQRIMLNNYTYQFKNKIFGPAPIISTENCQNYNGYLNNYFIYLEKKELLNAYFALGNAIWYFSVGIEAEMVFIQDDYGLVNRICEICEGLSTEHKLIDEEIATAGGFTKLPGYSKAAGHFKRCIDIKTVFITALTETTRLYKTSIDIRKNKSLIEQFSDLSCERKVAYTLTAGVTIGALIYFGSAAIKALSRNNDNQETNDKSSNRLRILASGAIGITCAGVIVVVADHYKNTLEQKRILKEMSTPNSILQRKILDPTQLDRLPLSEEIKTENIPSTSLKNTEKQQSDTVNSASSFTCTLS